MKKYLLFIVSLVLFNFLIFGCSTQSVNQNSAIHKAPPENFAKGKPGALVSVDMDSTVGVLLDEIPSSMRDLAATTYLSESENFWKERAKDQLQLTYYRLTFRGAFYDENEHKQQLPLPPEEIWNITIKGSPVRKTVDGHDLVLVDYTYSSTLLTDKDSPGISEPALEDINGIWKEYFTLPLDPKLLFQRTRFACMDEDQFPPLSVDPEEITSFYDHTCDVQDELANVGCHQTELPKTSCVDALKEKIGKIDTAIIFKRLPWNSALADKVRIGDTTSTTGADLQVFKKEFHTNRLNYRYIESDSCALEEKSVGAPGWRRILQFTTSDKNTGVSTLAIGAVDYFLKGLGSDLSLKGIFQFSPCHRHYHFTHYGTFYYGDKAKTVKQGFCLQSTQRVVNNESSPTHNPYFACDYQGVAIGWADQYKAGLENQWVDVTDVDTKEKPVTESLSFRSNPDGFLCEGMPVFDEKGNPVFEPTTFKTADGKTVSRPKCNFSENWDKNNADAYDVTLPTDGNGAVTSACKDGELGPLRDCDFKKNVVQNCTPGKKVVLHCSVNGNPQIVRVCDVSKVLGTAIPCSFNGPSNAQSLANKIVENETDISFTCPTAKDSQETGGEFSLYTAPILPGNTNEQVNCQQL